MIKLEKTEVYGWEAAIRGMRNPKNSWDRIDSHECVYSCDDCELFVVCNRNDEGYFKRFWNGDTNPECNFAVGPNDHKLMMDLASGGPVHAKYRRMITVYVDITAPLYWWKEFDTYKVGTVANSCSTMHKLTYKEFELDDFSHDKLHPIALDSLRRTVNDLNYWRDVYFKAKEMENPKPSAKEMWEQMIQLLPSSYNQKRTIMLNYEVLAGIYPMRKNHKLDEWHVFCDWIKSLPYSEIIIGTDQAFQYDEEEVAKFVTKVLEKDPNAFDRVYPVSSKELREALARSEKKEE